MAKWSDFKAKYCLDYTDLPDQVGPNVVVIERFDTEEYVDPATKDRKIAHKAYMLGWNLPLRLGARRRAALERLFGPNVEDAIGKQIALIVMEVEKWGEAELDIVIMHHQVPPGTVAAPVPLKHATSDQFRLAAAKQAGVTIGDRHPSQGAASLPPGHTPSVLASGAKLGYDAAAELCAILKERNRDWAWLRKHMEENGLAALVAADMPHECDGALKAPAWRLLKELPLVNGIPDRDAFKRDLINRWRPTLAQEAAKVAAEDDDIPF